MYQKLRFILVICFLASVGWGEAGPASKYGPRQFDGEGFTAIVVAYAPEMKGLLQTIDEDPDAEIVEEVTFKGIKYRLGNYNGHPILVFASGMSIANAAMSLQMAIDYFPIKRVLYMGIAGGVNPELHPGDVVIPERWYYHDESVYANPDLDAEGAYLVPPYYEEFQKALAARREADPNIPAYENFGYIHPMEVHTIKAGMDEPEHTPYFTATASLLEALEIAVGKMEPQMINNEREVSIRVGGNGVSGSVFLDNREYRKWIRKVFKAEVTEMESASVAQVCMINEIDWVIIRALSDLAGGQEGVNVEAAYDFPVSLIAAKVLFSLLEEVLPVEE